MNSALLDQIGLGWLDITYFLIAFIVLIIILFVLNIISLVKLKKWKKKYEAFMLGKDAQSMEKEITDLFSDIEFLKNSATENKKEIRSIYRRLRTTYQKLGIVKYDAFNEMGGQLSFALALLDEGDNGFVINSVHSSEGSYCYTKVIENGECDIALGDEETQAIKIAMKETEQNKK